MKDGITLLINSMRSMLNEQRNKYLKKNRFLYNLKEDKMFIKSLIENYDTLQEKYIEQEVRKINGFIKINVDTIDKETLNIFSKKIDQLYKEISEEIDSIMYSIKEYERVIYLFNRNERTITTPLTPEQFNLITNVLLRDRNLGYVEQCIILEDINKLNLLALKKRDELKRKEYQERKAIEKAKKDSLKKLKKKKIQPKAKEVVETTPKEIIDLTEDEKKTLEKCNLICTINKSIIEEGFDKDIIEAYEVGLEEDCDPIILFNSDSDKLQFVVKMIYDILNDYEKTYNKSLIEQLNNYLDKYDLYKLKVDEKKKEDKKIEQLSKDNEDLLLKAEKLVEKYNKMLEKFSENEINLLKSIPQIIERSSSLDSAENIKTINEFCSGTSLNYNIYVEMDNLGKIKDYYEIFYEEKLLSAREDILRELENEINEYLAVLEAKKNREQEDIKDEKEYENKNILLYLMDENYISGVEMFASENKTELNQLNKRIRDSIKEFKYSSVNDIFIASEPVKSNGIAKYRSYNEKARRIRYGDIRLIYANINSFYNMGLPNDLNNIYVILTCGPKKGNTYIYDFVNRYSVVELTYSFFNTIREKVQEIRQRQISIEQQDEMIKEYINKIVESNNLKFEESLKRLEVSDPNYSSEIRENTSGKGVK